MVKRSGGLGGLLVGRLVGSVHGCVYQPVYWLFLRKDGLGPFRPIIAKSIGLAISPIADGLGNRDRGLGDTRNLLPSEVVRGSAGLPLSDSLSDSLSQPLSLSLSLSCRLLEEATFSGKRLTLQRHPALSSP